MSTMLSVHDVADGEPLDVLGDLVTILADGASTAGSAMVCEVVTWPGESAPPHAHAPAETMVIVEGEVVIFRDGSEGAEELIASAGSVVVIPPNALHRYANRSEHPARFIAVMNPAGLEGFFREVGTPTLAGERPAPPQGPPDVARVLEIADKHGITFPAAPHAPDG